MKEYYALLDSERPQSRARPTCCTIIINANTLLFHYILCKLLCFCSYYKMVLKGIKFHQDVTVQSVVVYPSTVLYSLISCVTILLLWTERILLILLLILGFSEEDKTITKKITIHQRLGSLHGSWPRLEALIC